MQVIWGRHFPIQVSKCQIKVRAGNREEIFPTYEIMTTTQDSHSIKSKGSVKLSTTPLKS